MPPTTISGHELAQDPQAALNAADCGPVIITDRAQPAHVLLSIGDYRKLTSRQMTIADALAQAGSEDCEFEALRANIQTRPAFNE